MNSCSDCLHPSCGKNVDVFINYSRFHGFCNQHYSVALLSSSVSCSFCHSSLKIYPDLPLKRKVDFYNQLSHLDIQPLVKAYSSEPISSNQLSKPASINDPKASNSSNKKIASEETKKASKMLINQSSEEKMNHNIRDATTIQIQCSERYCTSKRATKLCNAHAFCEKHTKKNGDYLTCNLCRCLKCKSNGMYILPICKQKYCSNPACKDIIKCCFVCCQKGDIEMKSCKHFLCENHNKKGFNCPCQKCIYCDSTPVKTRRCQHLVCKDCEYEESCRKCLEGSCELCGNFEPIKTKNCVHKMCENCKDKICSICHPICTHCKNKESSLQTSCKTHPKCEECENLFQGLNCVYCGNLDEYTCSKCNQIVPELTKYGCLHKYCHLCNEKLDCNHTTMCKICLDNYKFCLKCHPNWICAICNKFDSNDDFTCMHNFCKACGILNDCGHFKCSQCKLEDFMNNGECLRCTGSICDFCSEINIVNTIECNRHKACKKCENTHMLCVLCNPLKKCLFCERNFQIDVKCNEHPYCFECANVAKSDSCIVCSKTFQKLQCSFCLRLYEKLNPIKCGHSACLSCLQINEEICEICKDFKCTFCLNEHKMVTAKCEHPLCENCQKIIGDQPCPKCKGNKQEFECQVCKSFSKLIPFNECKHQICIKCNKYSVENCIICTNICNYCNKTKENLIINLSCNHYFCMDCYNGFIHKNELSCIFCLNNQQDFTCNNCKCIFNDLNKQKCRHLLCGNCSVQKCFECKEGPCTVCGEISILIPNKCTHLLCEKCLDSGYCRICDKNNYCKKCESYMVVDNEMCEHLICEPCRKNSMCEECLCEVCKINELKYRCLYGHRACDNCIRYDGCPVCLKTLCELCSQQIAINFKECGHHLCEKCLKYEKCYICKPESFCISCETNLLKNCICCHHICSNCRKNNPCIFCKCILCEKTINLEKKACGHLICSNCNKKKCLCYNDACQNCNKPNNTKEKKKCGHLVCQSCKDARECFVCNPKSFCISCRKVKNEEYCDHGNCYMCISSENACDCRKMCSSCNKFRPILLNTCGHNVCLVCSRNKNCRACYEASANCCFRKNTEKILHICGNHLMCKNCYNSQLCYGCNPQHFCKICNKCDSLQLHCERKLCFNCCKRQKCCYCNTCKSTKLDYRMECGHYSCKCTVAYCKVCYFNNCEICNRTEIAKSLCKVCNKIICEVCLETHECLYKTCGICNSRVKTLCSHQYCETCLNSPVCPCFCKTCQKLGKNLRKCSKFHTYCDNCCIDCSCPLCVETYFIIGEREISNHPAQKNLEFDKGPMPLTLVQPTPLSLVQPIPLTLCEPMQVVCTKCKYFKTANPRKKCDICLFCCSSDFSKVEETEFELKYLCCMKTYCKRCWFMTSNSLGKRRYHLCKFD